MDKGSPDNRRLDPAGRRLPSTLETILLGPDDSIRRAMEAIEAGGLEIGLVVDRAARLLGTVSDGDIRRALLGGASLNDTVKPHIQTNAVTVSELESRAAVLDVMQARAITQVPIVDDAGQLVGMHLLRELLGRTERPNVAVIMAGGQGVRLRPLTEATPKPMLRVAGRPILERLVVHLVGYGFRRIVLAVNYLSEQIVDHFGDGEGFGCEISYIHEDPAQPLGTGGALAMLNDVVGDVHDPVLLLNGDLVTQFDADGLLAHHRRSNAMATLAVRDYTHQVPFGVVQESDDGFLSAFVEKPVLANRVSAGIYVLDPGLLKRVPRDLPTPATALLDDCLSRGERVALWSFDDEWHDVGRRADLRRATGQTP